MKYWGGQCRGWDTDIPMLWEHLVSKHSRVPTFSSQVATVRGAGSRCGLGDHHAPPAGLPQLAQLGCGDSQEAGQTGRDIPSPGEHGGSYSRYHTQPPLVPSSLVRAPEPAQAA